MLKKNDNVELEIIDLTDEGLGVSKKNGQVFFVKDALPDDKVYAVITKITKNVIYAKTINLIKESKYRVKTKCNISDSCGGCQLLRLDYEFQIRFKKNLVFNKLNKIGGIDVKKYYDELIVNDNPCHFRNKMQVPFSIDKNNNIVYGFYAGRTHYIIPFDYCMVGFNGAELILNEVRDTLKEFEISIYNENTKQGVFREVYLRIGNVSKEISLVYIVNDLNYNSKTNFYKKFDEKVREKITNNKNIDSIIITTCLNINTSDNNVLLGNTNVVLYGNGYIYDSIGDVKYQISTNSFYQVNINMTKKLYDKIVEYGDFKINENVLDLFSGIGTISLYISKYVSTVTGFEIIYKAVEDSVNNAKINNITNAYFKCIDLYKNDLNKYIENKTFDTVIVDPPRKGLDLNTINLIIDLSPKKLIYVSCDVATLARDLKILCDNGFNIKKISNVDMFSHTTHIESVVLLTKIIY